MAQNAVVTELTIDSSGAERGAASFADAMAKAQAAANDNLKSIADNTAALNGQMENFGKTTQDAVEKSSFSFSGFATKLAIGAAAAALGIGALYTAFKVLYEVITFVPSKIAEAWDLGTAKLAEYVALGEKAAAANISAEFYQRITKAAEGAKLSVDDLTAALQRMEKQSAGQLGGSTGQKRLDELLKAGNFDDNAGASQFKNANSAEERYRAISMLINQAMKDGERLAALDIAKTFFGDKVADNLAKDAGYLDKMNAAADAIKADDLISNETVANAKELQDRMDAAEKILSQRWHPIQDLLTEAGIKMREAWVGIVEQIASAVDWAARLMGKLAEAPSWFQDKINKGASWFTDMTTTPESRREAESRYGITSDPAAINGLADQQRFDAARRNGQLDDARRRLAEQMNRTFDTSKSEPGKPAPGPDTSAFDRAEELLRKYIETTSAAAKSINMTTEAQERLKAVAQLTAAGMKDGLTREAAAAKAEMSGFADQAARAAGELAKAQVQSQIKIGRDTALLSQEDVQIASQLRGLYPGVATALNSVEANALRTNAAFRSMSSTIETNLTTGITDAISGAKTFGQAMQDTGKVVVRALEEMIVKMLIIQPLMRSLQGGLGGMFGGLFGGGGGVAQGPMPDGSVIGSAHGNAFAGGNVIPFAKGGVIDGPMIAPMALMGEAGPEAIVPLKRGADGNLGIAGGAGGGALHIDASDNRQITINGGDQQSVAQIREYLAKDRAERESVIVATVQKARQQRRL